ncbi:MAG: biopolymer transporter ExbD [Bacteroidales bacterium]|nr:biopolymer transporter ExbD [Bacteroidales bacterium]MCF8396731.1 biopolymer transporter ExbD [Bacteroidales bacterium]
MAIKPRNKRDLQFNMASFSDLVFLLLIFFMLTSTLVAPNAIKLLLPQSNSRTMATQTVTVYINERMDYFVGETPVSLNRLESVIDDRLKGEIKASIVLRSDQTVPVQYVVNVIDAVNNINNKYNTKHKVILATRPNR